LDFKYGNNRVYAEDESGRLIAEVNFPQKYGVYHITHTYVSPELRGKGVADEMLHTAVDIMSSTGAMIKPVCSYATKWFGQHPEYSRFEVK